MRAIFTIFLGFFICCPAYADIYFWVDDNGIKHYANTTLPPDRDVQALKESRRISGQIRSAQNQAELFRVVKVYDGDTIQAKGAGLVFKVRLVGIDAPETGFKARKSQPFSQKAKKYLLSLVDGRDVALKSYGIGGYNRQLAELFLNGENINLKMVRAGLAEVYKGRRPDTLDSTAYLRAERTAQKTSAGMWRLGNAYKSPRQWRKDNPIK